VTTFRILQKALRGQHHKCFTKKKKKKQETKVMAFGVRALGSVQVRWGGATVEEVDEYKYLGLMLEKSGKWKARSTIKGPDLRPKSRPSS